MALVSDLIKKFKFARSLKKNALFNKGLAQGAVDFSRLGTNVQDWPVQAEKAEAVPPKAQGLGHWEQAVRPDPLTRQLLSASAPSPVKGNWWDAGGLLIPQTLPLRAEHFSYFAQNMGGQLAAILSNDVSIENNALEQLPTVVPNLSSQAKYSVPSVSVNLGHVSSEQSEPTGINRGKVVSCQPGATGRSETIRDSRLFNAGADAEGRYDSPYYFAELLNVSRSLQNNRADNAIGEIFRVGAISLECPLSRRLPVVYSSPEQAAGPASAVESRPGWYNYEKRLLEAPDWVQKMTTEINIGSSNPALIPNPDWLRFDGGKHETTLNAEIFINAASSPSEIGTAVRTSLEDLAVQIKEADQKAGLGRSQ